MYFIPYNENSFKIAVQVAFGM